MTMEELRTSTATVLRPQDVAEILVMHPQTINLMAKKGELPFPYIRSGNRTKIPRLAFMKFLGMNVSQAEEREAKEDDYWDDV